ncbi:4'-phosphopantetheinyl transferase [Streptomyces sp. NPDC091272]|uniref:4'-phosphopantetheinyl transferase family protein n=1 Tax=Streptomyces sp. NPDC091272 TaxID=3365981 RepID=UPI00382FBE02
MIEQLLSGPVVALDSFTDTGDDELFPEERAAVATAGAGRRREFTTVRHCARAALGGLGLPPVPLLPDAHGAPRWPDGVVGSMTHCRGYRAAAVARRGEVRSLGIDAEPHRPLRDGVLETVSVPGERERHAALARLHPAVCWDRLLFCAKEAVYKAWFPLTRTWLDFSDVRVTFDPAAGRFAAEVRDEVARGAQDAPASYTGRWTAGADLLLTAVVVRRGAA